MRSDEIEAGPEGTGIKEQYKANRVEIVFYTDPLCCWSWAFEPQWRRLQYEFRDCLVFRNVMTGLLPSWKNYIDPVYSVSRPSQMGPVWMEASNTSGMPMDHKIWVSDPPASSYPACIAVKSAELQSKVAGVKYLRLLREAVMLTGKNIASQEVLIEVANDLATKRSGLIDAGQFADDLVNGNGLNAFRADWQEAQNQNISRTPTLIMRSNIKPAIIITGYRPYSALLQAVAQVAPGFKRSNQLSLEDYKRFWGNLTAREIVEVEGQ